MNTCFNNLSRRKKNFYRRAMKAYSKEVNKPVSSMKYLFGGFNDGNQGRQLLDPRGYLCYLEVPGTARGFVMMAFCVTNEVYLGDGKVRVSRRWLSDNY